MVCLLNEFSASDGDLFPYRFRQLQARQADRQAELGRRGRHPRLAAAARRRHAEQARSSRRYDVDGKEWIIEGHGVDPDIVVDNDPAKEFAGDDQQLNRAIEEAKELLKTGEKKLPELPPYPKR